MKKQILLLVFAGLMQSLIANDPATEKTGLIQNSDKEGKSGVPKQTINWTKWRPVAFAVTMAGVLGVGTWGIVWIATRGGESGIWAPRLPQCNPVPWNRTEAACESTLPSDDWDPLCAQLNAVRAYSNKTCVPGCHWNIQKRRGVFPTAVGKERKLPEEVNVQFHEYDADEYAYAVCEDKPHSWLHRVKSFFSNHDIPYWTIKTESGVEWHDGGPDMDEYPTEGLVYPEKYSSYVFDEELYNSEILPESHTVAYSMPCLRKFRRDVPCWGERGW